MANPLVQTVAATPGAALTTLYTVPANRRSSLRYLQVTNIAGTDKTYRLAISPAGAAIDNAHYLAYDATVTASDNTAWSGIALGAGDIVRCYGVDNNVQFFLSYYEDDA